MHHAAGLRRLLAEDEQWIARDLVAGDVTRLDPMDRALLDFAARLTLEPAAAGAAGVERLRAAGFGDREIHDAVQAVAYFAYANRIALGLGVELGEDEGPPGGWPKQGPAAD